MKFTRRGFLAGAGAMLAAPPVLAGSPPTLVLEGPAFGAAFHVVLPSDTDAAGAASAVRGIVSRIDRSMSPFRQDSEIARFNATDSTDWCRMSGDCMETLSEALRIARWTSGAFDPTVGGIVGRYGFGPIRRISDGTFRDIATDPGAVRKDDPGLTLDLCGIAKGYALDRIADEFARLRLRDYLVELGGEIRARGRHPSGRNWRAGIERPGPGERRIQRTVAMGGDALATSGLQVNGFAYRGRQYGHIIDARRGKPAAGDLASVSVFASSAATADALATAMFAMEWEEGAGFAQTHAIPSLFLVREGDGIREIATGDFDSRFEG